MTSYPIDDSTKGRGGWGGREGGGGGWRQCNLPYLAPQPVCLGRLDQPRWTASNDTSLHPPH